ncbi:MAG: glycosyltransferase family A protein [Nitrososphaerales archaeon]
MSVVGLVISIIILLVLVVALVYVVREPSEQRRFVVSLTSTPQRVKKILPTLRSLLYQTYPPEMIYLCLPEKFRNKEPYPPLEIGLERVKIVRTPEDYGPATKLLGILPHIDQQEDIFILYCDDDIIYPEGMLEAHNRKARKGAVNGTALHPRGFLEGFGGISVHRSLLKEDLIPFVKKVGACLDCYLSDDLVIGKYFENHHIPTNRVVSLSYYKRIICKQAQEYGEAADALHKGSNGLTEEDNHRRKYDRCRHFLTGGD